MSENFYPRVKSFYDKKTHTLTYVVYSKNSKGCCVIDPVANLEYNSGKMSYESNAMVAEFVKNNDLEVEWILETHVHADHITGASNLQSVLGGKIAISKNITKVQKVFAPIFGLDNFATDGSQFDYLFSDEEILKCGDFEIKVLSTTGHTPACSSFIVGNSVFVGDTIFMPDSGSARVDFPNGSVEELYESIQKILSLPKENKLYVGHDYQPNFRELLYQTTVGEQKEGNIHCKDSIDKEEFIKIREERDKTLDMPKLILPAIQLNIQAGKLPEKSSNGISYLKIPINQL